METERIESLLELIHLLPQEERILLAARLRQHEHTHSQHPDTTPNPDGQSLVEQSIPAEVPTALETVADKPQTALEDAAKDSDDINSGLWAERDEPNSQSRKDRILRQDKWLS